MIKKDSKINQKENDQKEDNSQKVKQDLEQEQKNPLITFLLNTVKTFQPALRASTLLLIFAISFLVRIFSVIRYEAIIHEFDPWFNYRATNYLFNKGSKEFTYWFDTDSWYPLGRFVGHTVFPGLMHTTVFIKKVLDQFLIPIDLRYICVFTAPFFSMITAFLTYKITIEVNQKNETGLLAALFISVIPAYLSRSVAGSYDNEAISISLLMLTFYLFLVAAKSGSFIQASLCALAYSYLVASWGGYSFVITFLPVFVVAVLITKMFDYRIYVAYSVFYIIGCFWSMQTKFVEFKIWHKSEHLGSHFVFILLQGKLIYDILSKHLKVKHFQLLLKSAITLMGLGAIAGTIYLGFMGKTKFSERVMTLLDPTYAKNYIPIIASVSEHQPTTWTTFFFDLHFTLLFAPLGLYYTLRNTTKPKLFIALYFVTAVYFASLMVRLLLLLAPVLCILSAIGISELLHSLFRKFKLENIKKLDLKYLGEMFKIVFVSLMVALLGFLVLRYMMHGSIVGAEVYSSPSVVLSNRNYQTGEKHVIDDFREAYYWLRKNSPERSKILSWWDYGYQIAGFSNRTTIVDNNTWNFTHISYVGKIFASNEEEAYDILENLNVDYVLVIFGGRTGFSGDDMNKFLWIIRIAGNAFPNIKENDYINQGFAVNEKATEAMKNSIMYKLSYYRFWEEYTGRGKGYDLVRQAKIGHINYKLKYFEEVFTSYRWLVRIYKVKKKKSRDFVAFTPKNIMNSKKESYDGIYEDSDYEFIK